VAFDEESRYTVHHHLVCNICTKHIKALKMQSQKIPQNSNPQEDLYARRPGPPELLLLLLLLENLRSDSEYRGGTSAQCSRLEDCRSAARFQLNLKVAVSLIQ
jgi:hypothetical protein